MDAIERPTLAKFVEKKQGIRDSEEEKKIDVAPLSSSKPKINRQVVCPGPAEIISAVKSRPTNKQEIIRSCQFRAGGNHASGSSKKWMN